MNQDQHGAIMATAAIDAADADARAALAEARNRFPRKPLDDEEREACDESRADRSACNVKSGRGFACARPRPHPGRHIAAGVLRGEVVVLDSWGAADRAGESAEMIAPLPDAVAALVEEARRLEHATSCMKRRFDEVARRIAHIPGAQADPCECTCGVDRLIAALAAQGRNLTDVRAKLAAEARAYGHAVGVVTTQLVALADANGRRELAEAALARATVLPAASQPDDLSALRDASPDRGPAAAENVHTCAACVDKTASDAFADHAYVQHGGDIVRMPGAAYREWLAGCARGHFLAPEDVEGAVVVGRNILFYRVDFGREDFARLMREQGIAGAVFHATPPCCYDEPDGEPEGYDVDSGLAVCEGCGGAIGAWKDGPGFMPFTTEERSSWDVTKPMERRNAPARQRLTPFTTGTAEGADARWRYIAENYEAAISLGANPDRRVVVDRLIDGRGWFWIVWGRDEEILATSHEDCPLASPEEAEAEANVAAAEFYDMPEEG